MWRIEPRRLVALGAIALGLRLICAMATEFHPLFPSYYYTDPQLVEQAASRTLAMRRDGLPYRFQGTLSQRLQVEFLIRIYETTGHRPFIVKAINSTLGAGAIVILAAALAPAFGAAPALAAGMLAAVWPSGIFFTSHNFKEAPTNLLAYTGLLCLMLLLSDPRRTSRYASFCAGGALVALVACGFYRSYLLLALCGVFGVAFAWALICERKVRPVLIGGLLVCAAAPALYTPLADTVMRRALSATGGTDSPYSNVQLIPLTVHEPDAGGSSSASASQRMHRPTSPEGITAFRKSRQFADRRFAREKAKREIETQIFPDAAFKSWLDVALYLPKGLFYVLFMPLPGLYPIEGKLGRLAASVENAALLAVCLLGLVGIARGPKTPARLAPVLFLGVMAAGAALLEFDLGSASRHKLLFLPMLFPCAFEEFRRLLGRV